MANLCAEPNLCAKPEMMPMKELEFIRWAKRESLRRGMICHFYIAESTKQYYDKTDYAYFNFFCDSRDWIVKGTLGHGIKSQRGKTSPIPCLNCFEINDEFYKAFKKLCSEGNEKFELGIIFNKRKLKNRFETIDVSTEWPDQLPPPNQCHRYDNPRYRRGVLDPFNYCDVVRVEIPESNLHKIPIKAIPYQAVMGMLIKRKDRSAIVSLLKSKRMDKVKVFALL